MALLWIIWTFALTQNMLVCLLNFEWPAGFIKTIYEITVTDADDMKEPQVYRECQKWGHVYENISRIVSALPNTNSIW